MADLHDTVCSSSSPPPESDDISLFLHQVFFRSSSSSSPSPFPHHDIPYRPTLPAESSSLLNSPAAGSVFSTSGGCFPPATTVVSSSSVGNTDNDIDDQYDCESEDGYEAMVEEARQKPPNYSKRSRAAEIHNLSEKRRRSRINEKMKALQKLIPNSNKTDKASMLDEAIEYLKQLQLQVQMLTMRNGLSLYPQEGLQINNEVSHFRRPFSQENGQSDILHLHHQEHGLNSQTLIQNHHLPPYQAEDNNNDSLASFHKQRNMMMIHESDQPDLQMGSKGPSSSSDTSMFFDPPFEWHEHRKRSYRG